MLITICYALLTWNESRKRAQVGQWIKETLSQSHSLLLIRKRIGTKCDSQLSPLSRTKCLVSSTPSLTSSTLTRDELWRPVSSLVSLSSAQSLSNLLPQQGQISSLSTNQTPRAIRLLWESPDTKALVISPHQTVELHDWTSWTNSEHPKNEGDIILLLLEAEAGLLVDKRLHRKFSKFGLPLAWKCNNEFAIILQSTIDQVVELMHIYRLTGLILEGGWTVYRVTTVSVQGGAGTLISWKGSYTLGSGFSPAGLRRLSATGTFECTGSPVGGTPKNCLSKETSVYKIPLISEDSQDGEGSEEDQVSAVIAPLLNWHERSPRKLSSPNVLHRDRASYTLPRRKTSRSSSLSEKSLSLVSLFSCSKNQPRSASVDEEAEDFHGSGTESSGFQDNFQQQSREVLEDKLSQSQQQLKQSRNRISVSTSAMDRCSSPNNRQGAVSTSSCERKMSPSPNRITPSSTPLGQRPNSNARRGKPPNILILCQDDPMRQKIHTLLKSILPSDRYAIYEIRWDQLSVGGWADQTALLVLAGAVPDPTVNLPLLLQFLGDGGRLFAWCAESPPFGITRSSTEQTKKKGVVVYGPALTQTQELVFETGWGQVPQLNAPSMNFPRIVETVDSEGTSRPLTNTVIGKSKEGSQSLILQLDGGNLGGKAILSRICFEDNLDESLLSYLLNGTLGLDCRTVKSPEYTPGFLLGDHKKILDFVGNICNLWKYFPPANQMEFKVEFVPRGEKGPDPNRDLFPIHHFECPKHFSTVEYFDNLETRDLGRLVIYSDVISSVMNVLSGRPLANGIVVIAKQQTAGRGRGKNVWLSPEGSALFAFQIHVSSDKGIGRRLSLIQHITALAVILAVPPHREIDLCVKWPNDIYLGAEKVGGIIVESIMDGRMFVVNIGVGLNVSNTYPTTSVNKALKDAKGSGNPELDWSVFSVERLIARMLTQLEHLLDSIDKECGLEEILHLYSSNWIHSEEEEVNVEMSKGNWTTCRILCIDEYGFMRVREVETGNTFSVQPDGNSFDIANRLISIKQ